MVMEEWMAVLKIGREDVDSQTPTAAITLRNYAPSSRFEWIVLATSTLLLMAGCPFLTPRLSPLLQCTQA